MSHRATVLSALPVARMYSEKGLNAMQLISLVCAPSTQCFACHHASRAALSARPPRSDESEREQLLGWRGVGRRCARRAHLIVPRVSRVPNHELAIVSDRAEELRVVQVPGDVLYHVRVARVGRSGVQDVGRLRACVLGVGGRDARRSRPPSRGRYASCSRRLAAAHFG